MRVRIVLLTLLPALVILALAVVLKPKPAAKDAPVPVASSNPPVPISANKTSHPDLATMPLALALPQAVQKKTNLQNAVTPAPVATLAPEQRQERIDAEVDRLQDLALSDDPASLPPILAALTNTESEVREAAIEAAMQFGSRDAIPALKAAATNTTDLEERANLLDAADFLALPSFSELQNSLRSETTGDNGTESN